MARNGAEQRHELTPADPVSPFLHYHSLSLLDLLVARNLFHLHLTERKGAIATAVGRYLIRRGDSWPGEKKKTKGTGPKNFFTAEVRSYSWPCVLVFVEKWREPDELSGHGYGPHDLIPDRLYMPDGKVVPVCVVEAQSELVTEEPPFEPLLPKNFFGGGYPIVAEVQGERHMASIGCLLSDGHTVYALTNRHVAGAPGEQLYAPLEGQLIPMGVSSKKQIGRIAFESVYEGWPGKDVYLNADIGLVEVTDVTRWTPQVYSIGTIGPLADFSTQNLSLDLVNAEVRAYGAASKEMFGRVWALFYRYKSLGGFEFLSDLLIGPRKQGDAFRTQHGDSGTLWLLEPTAGATNGALSTFRPLGVQWGGQVFTETGGGGQTHRSFALATLLSTVCRHLNVELIRDWGFSLPEYWGTFGHFTIANMACQIVASDNSKLRRLMRANLENITFQLDDVTVEGTKGLSKGDFVPLADVPDLVWKMPSGDGSRGPRGRNPESPNHFADMDEVPPDSSPTLLRLCDDADNINPQFWIEHAQKFPPKPGADKDPAHDMGLLPFRVWQLFDAMVGAVRRGKGDEFICAAGTLAHYVGDACQPLHISFLHHGDPKNFVTRKVTHTRGKKAGTSEDVNVSQGVHEDYEQTMFRGQNGERVKSALQARTATRGPAEPPIRTGHDAAVAVVRMMQLTFKTIPPRKIVDAYDQALRGESTKSEILDMLRGTFGNDTVSVMSFGCRLLARLWENAWAAGDGDRTIKDLSASTHKDLRALYVQRDVLPSFRLTEIEPHLSPSGRPANGHAPAGPTRPRRPATRRGASPRMRKGARPRRRPRPRAQA
jgi:hypothetical protein